MKPLRQISVDTSRTFITPGDDIRRSGIKVPPTSSLIGGTRLKIYVRNNGGRSTLLKRLPKNKNKIKKYRDLNVHELGKIEIPAIDRLSVKTYNKYIARITQMCKFCRTQGWLNFNPFEGLNQRENSDERDRLPFSNDDLQKIIDGYPQYILGRKFDREKHSYRFFLPIMGIFTGCRLNELCQLELDDFKTVNNIHCISIERSTEDQKGKGKKRIKTKSSKRVIPLHDSLIAIGLLDRVEELRQRSERRFFPELRFTERGGFGDRASEDMNNYLKKIGVWIKLRKVFHSFRHTLATELRRYNPPDGFIEAIAGHDHSSEAKRTYTDWTVIVPQLKHKAIDHLSFGNLDLKLLTTKKFNPYL